MRRVAAVVGVVLVVAGCSPEDAQPPEGPGAEVAVVADTERSGSPEPAPPNLLLITMDTTRADALGAYGQQLPTSPNIDRLAREGVLFEQVATTNPETLPSHSTIFTGRWPYAHGVRANGGYILSDRNVTLAERLRDRGYVTGAEVAAPVLRRETHVTQGFDHYRGAESPGAELKKVFYRDDDGETQEHTVTTRIGSDIARSGLEFLRAHRDEPFFLWLHFFDAHAPHVPPTTFYEKLDEDGYHGEIASADFQIGMVLRELERLGLRDRTLVVLTADHGEGLSEHGEPSHSFFVYDTVMRVPLVVAGLPELPAGKRVTSLVRTVDIAPTIAALLGLPPLEDADGTSLLPLIRGQRDDLDLPAYGEATRFKATFDLPVLRFLRRGRWKYIHKVNPELYDVVADPHELTNLADRHPEVVERLRGELEALLAAAPEPPHDAQAAIDAETGAQLMALGYVARSPVFEVGNEVAELALHGDDPSSYVEDVQILSKVSGLLGRGDFTRALAMLLELRSHDPDRSFVREYLGQAYAGLGRYAEAVEELRVVVRDEPENLEARFALAGALVESGAGGEAIRILQGVLGEQPCDERALLELADALRRAARHADLVEMLRAGSEQCPDLSANRNNYAWALATLPEPDLRNGPEAVRVIEEILADAPDDPAFLDTLSAARAEAGDLPGAIEAVNRALDALREASVPPEVVAEVEGHLRAYRAGEPIRDPAS